MRHVGPDDVVAFHLCPSSVFSFADDAGPLVLETPLRHPVVLACLAGDEESAAGCVFADGAVHLLINNDALDDEDLAQEQDASSPPPSPAEAVAPSLTVTGVHFHNASRAAVLLQDPRSAVRLNGCRWEDNGGEAAVLVNGTYVRPVVITTTSSTEMNWDFLGDDDGLGDVGEDRGRALRVNDRRAAAAGHRGDAGEVGVTTTAASEASMGLLELPLTYDQGEAASVFHGGRVEVPTDPLHLKEQEQEGSHQLPLVDGDALRAAVMPEVHEENAVHLAGLSRRLDGDDAEAPRAMVSIENGWFSVSRHCNHLSWHVLLRCVLKCWTGTRIHRG